MYRCTKARLIIVASALSMVGSGLSTAARAEPTEVVVSDVLVASGCFDAVSPVPFVGNNAPPKKNEFHGPRVCDYPWDNVSPICQATSDPGDLVDQPLPQDCNGYMFSGTYDSITYATWGTFNGTVIFPAPEAWTIYFTVILMAGRGIFIGRSGSSDGESTLWETWSGVFDILPTQSICT